jgi:prepilin-type N-terminal cleavage/methylation domain-containing protein
MIRKTGDDGFTLLEVIASFVVAALILSIILPAGWLVRLQMSRAARTSENIALAARAVEETVLQAAPQKITSAGLTATSAITPVVSDDRASVQLMHIRVVVTQGVRDEVYRLETKRLVRRSPAV